MDGEKGGPPELPYVLVKLQAADNAPCMGPVGIFSLHLSLSHSKDCETVFFFSLIMDVGMGIPIHLSDVESGAGMTWFPLLGVSFSPGINGCSLFRFW